MWLVGQVSLATPPEVVTRIPASVDWGILAGSSRHNAKLTSGLAERRVRFPYALPRHKIRVFSVFLREEAETKNKTKNNRSHFLSQSSASTPQIEAPLATNSTAASMMKWMVK